MVQMEKTRNGWDDATELDVVGGEDRGAGGVPTAWPRPSGTWLCAKIRSPAECGNQARWAHTQAPWALRQAGLGSVPRRA